MIVVDGVTIRNDTNLFNATNHWISVKANENARPLNITIVSQNHTFEIDIIQIPSYGQSIASVGDNEFLLSTQVLDKFMNHDNVIGVHLIDSSLPRIDNSRCDRLLTKYINSTVLILDANDYFHRIINAPNGQANPSTTWR
jgi:hypothetical protein